MKVGYSKNLIMNSLLPEIANFMGIQPVLKHKPKCHIKCFSNIFPWNGWFYNHHTPICSEKSPILRNKRGSSMIFTGFFQTLTLSSAPFWLGGIRWHPFFLESHGDSHARWECPGLAGRSHHLRRPNWYQLFWWLRYSSFTILGKAYPENLEFYPIATVGSFFGMRIQVHRLLWLSERCCFCLCQKGTAGTPNSHVHQINGNFRILKWR